MNSLTQLWVMAFSFIWIFMVIRTIVAEGDKLRDRNRNGGGVLMYISTHLKYTVLPTCEGLELLAVVISNDCCTCKSCVLLFYTCRPPCSSFIVRLSLFLYRVLTHISLLKFYFYQVTSIYTNFCPRSSHPLFPTLEALASSFGLNSWLHNLLTTTIMVLPALLT